MIDIDPVVGQQERPRRSARSSATVADVLEDLHPRVEGAEQASKVDKAALKPSGGGRSRSGVRATASPTRQRKDVIMPQYAIERLYALTRDKRCLHHDRGRPASDVGGAVLQASRSRTAG
jgi:hypothetical protein